MNLFKAIRYNDYRYLQKGSYTHKTVNVFCGFDRYQDNVAAVNEIAQAVANAYPGIEQKDMTVWPIGRHESDRHASMMTIMINIPAEDVELNLSEYTIL